MKRAVRGMLPNHRWGRGREALKRIMCYFGMPYQYDKEKNINFVKENLGKHITLDEVYQ